MISREAGPVLQPGESLELKASRALTDTRQGANNIYLGNHIHYLEVAEIAKALCQGGSFELVTPAEQQPPENH